jgi:hypothetical protein
MPSSGMWRCAGLLSSDVSEETRLLDSVSDLVTLFLPRVTSSTLTMEATRSSETSAYDKATWRHIPQDAILHSRRREDLKSSTRLIFLSSSVHSCGEAAAIMSGEFSWGSLPVPLPLPTQISSCSHSRCHCALCGPGVKPSTKNSSSLLTAVEAVTQADTSVCTLPCMGDRRPNRVRHSVCRAGR